MNETANPIFVGLLFILRCLVPLALLFGISYLLRRFGLVVMDSNEPEGGFENDANDDEDDEDEDTSTSTNTKES